MADKGHGKQGKGYRKILLEKKSGGLAGIYEGAAGACYAANIGGIKREIQIWIHGDQTNAILEVESGHYSLDMIDDDGNVIGSSGGGGVAFDEDGVCYVKLVHDGKELYMTVKYKDGYGLSADCYMDPRSFNSSLPF